MEPNVFVSTELRSHDRPSKVVDAVRSIFPSWSPANIPVRETFPVQRNSEIISGNVESLDTLLTKLRENRILDTGLDAMAMRADKDGSVFFLSRQSASVGKVSFELGGSCFGGVIRVELKGPEIEVWLEQQTWHSGRDLVPRTVGDEYSMADEGVAAEWFDNKGRKTLEDSH